MKKSGCPKSALSERYPQPKVGKSKTMSGMVRLKIFELRANSRRERGGGRPSAPGSYRVKGKERIYSRNNVVDCY